MLSPNFESIRWVGGALSCGIATALMALTGTVHPPAGATALMAVADENVASMGWFLIPVVMVGCGVMLAMALLVNNIQRRFPYYWWTPEPTGEYWRARRQRASEGGDIDTPGAPLEKSTTQAKMVEEDNHHHIHPHAQPQSSAATCTSAISSSMGGDTDIELGKPPTEAGVATTEKEEEEEEESLVITRGLVQVPRDFYLTIEEKKLLETLSLRL